MSNETTHPLQTPQAGGEQHDEGLVDAVRDRYGKIASGEVGGCCGSTDGFVPTDTEGASRRIGYEEGDLDAVPDAANLGLGCGAPIAGLGLEPGEVVLDLGSGGGLDAFLAAREVGPTGRVIGVDMTPEMIERAQEGARNVGLEHVEFRQGRLEALPVDDGSIDAITSNCVINLVPDKGRVFAEAARVLKPGGRMVISDIVLERPLPETLQSDLLAYVGCISGAMLSEEYFDTVRAAGLGEIEILSDKDAMILLGDPPPAEALELLERTGTSVDEVRGAVRSVTFRARRPASS